MQWNRRNTKNGKPKLGEKESSCIIALKITCTENSSFILAWQCLAMSLDVQCTKGRCTVRGKTVTVSPQTAQCQALLRRAFYLGSSAWVWIVLPCRKIFPKHTVAVTRSGYASIPSAIPSVFFAQFKQMGQGVFNKNFQNLSSADDYLPQSLSACVLTPKAIFVFCLVVKAWGLKFWVGMVR